MATAINRDIDQGVISRNPNVVSGEAVFPGTRVTVRTLQDYLARGSSAQKFIADFPGVSKDQVVKVIELVFNRAIGHRDESPA